MDQALFYYLFPLFVFDAGASLETWTIFWIAEAFLLALTSMPFFIISLVIGHYAGKKWERVSYFVPLALLFCLQAGVLILVLVLNQ